jgi:tetratricopeptide (TPR) repeat protein
MRSLFAAIAACSLLAAPAAAQGHQHQAPDHQHQHDEAEVLGTVSFATTCRADVKPAFERAVALLHSFGYERARQAFEAVAADDASCGIAHWGIAMTYYHPLWAPPTPEELTAGRAAAERAAAVGAESDRERGFIEAINAFYKGMDVPHAVRAKAYTAATERVATAHQGDDEAQIFFALALLGTAPPHDTTHSQQKRAAAIVNPMLARLPQHPGILHYTIHAFDVPALAPLALDAARSYAKVAPASPHALHMPSHIFTRLGLWKEGIASNIDSAAAARAQSGTPSGPPSYNELHALDYLAYAYLQLGDDEAARKAVERVGEAAKIDDVAAAYAATAAPARYALERRDWRAAAALRVPQPLQTLDRLAFVRGVTHLANAIGAARSGDLPAAQAAVGELANLHALLSKAPPAGPYDWVGQVESMHLAALGWTAFADGRKDEALTLLTKAAEKEELVGKHPVTPGSILPARELLGDLLLELQRPAEALAAYERSLQDAPRRLNTLAGAVQAAKRAGNAERAKQYGAELGELCGRCQRPVVQQATTVAGAR